MSSSLICHALVFAMHHRLNELTNESQSIMKNKELSTETKYGKT